MIHQKKPIFKDPALQNHFQEQGYVTIPLLDEEQVEKLRKLYHEKANIELKADFNETTRQLDYERNKEISAIIKAEFDKGGNRFLRNHVVTGGTFFIKKAHVEHEMRLHQDWNIVDEERYISCQIWCPLQDVTEKNGAIVLIPASHRYFETFRSGSIHPPRFPSSIFMKGDIGHALKTIALKGGEALIYQHNLYHGSHPNTTAQHRLIVSGSILSEAASLLYFHQPSPSNNQIQVVDGTNDFFLKYIDYLADGKLPESAKIVKTLTKTPFYPGTNDILAKTRKAFPKKRGILNQIKQWLKN